MTQREVTERDFRAPEFRDAKVEDYEFRDDGKVVRKDRWETGIRLIAGRLGLSRQGFEVTEIVHRVDDLIGPDWEEVADPECTMEVQDAEWPEHEEEVQVRLRDGSVVNGVRWDGVLSQWKRKGFHLTREGRTYTADYPRENVVIAWRRMSS